MPKTISMPHDLKLNHLPHRASIGVMQSFVSQRVQAYERLVHEFTRDCYGFLLQKGLMPCLLTLQNGFAFLRKMEWSNSCQIWIWNPQNGRKIQRLQRVCKLFPGLAPTVAGPQQKHNGAMPMPRPCHVLACFQSSWSLEGQATTACCKSRT